MLVVYGSAKTCFSQDTFLPRHVSPKTRFSQDMFLSRHGSPKTRFSQDTTFQSIVQCSLTGKQTMDDWI